MLPNDRAQPAAPDKPSWGPGCCARTGGPRPGSRSLAVAAAVLLPGHAGLIILAALIYGIVAVAQGRRTVGASASVALWGVVVSLRPTAEPDLALFGDPAALRGRAGRPRQAAGPLFRAVPHGRLGAGLVGAGGAIALKSAPHQPFIGTIAAWLLAAAVLGWRVAKGIQDTRMYGGAEPRARTAGPAGSQGHAAGRRRAPGEPRAPAIRGRPAGYGVRAQAAALPYADHAARDHQGGTPPGRGRRSRSRTRWPSSTR